MAIGSSPRRPRAPSANGCHGEPPVRVHASGPKPTLAPSYKPQRGEQAPQPHAGVGDGRRVARGRLPAHHDEQVRAPRAGRPEGVGGRVLGEGVALHERQPVAEGQLGRGDLEAQQRRDDHRLGAPVVERRLDLAVGALEALGAEREVGGLLEDAAEEDAQGELGARARLGRVPALAARLEVVAQPAAARRARARRAGSSAAAPSSPTRSSMKSAGQRAVAVQRAVAARRRARPRRGPRRRRPSRRRAARPPPRRRRRARRGAGGCAWLMRFGGVRRCPAARTAPCSAASTAP